MNQNSVNFKSLHGLADEDHSNVNEVKHKVVDMQSQGDCIVERLKI